MRIQIDELHIEQPIDTAPDLSHLEDPEVQGHKYFAENQQRLKAYGEEWFMVGIIASADILIPTKQGGFLRQKLKSGGLWGIESDSDREYFQEVAKEEMADLKDVLSQFNIDLDDFDKYAENVISAV